MQVFGSSNKMAAGMEHLVGRLAADFMNAYLNED